MLDEHEGRKMKNIWTLHTISGSRVHSQYFFLAVILIPAQNKFGDKDWLHSEGEQAWHLDAHSDFLYSDILVKESKEGWWTRKFVG